MREIGSYFEFDFSIQDFNNKQILWLPKYMSDYTLTFSGRSAIELAVTDILKVNNIKRVYMPSYCCASMLSTFKNYDIEIEFYNVCIGKGNLVYEVDENLEIDLFFAMSYFGLDNGMDDIIEKMKCNNVIVLEDITHRLLSKNTHSFYSDYIVASLRKWFPIPTGGLLMKKEGKIENKPTRVSNYLVKDQILGMKMKAEYLISNNKIKKDVFLDKFKTLNSIISTIDYTYKIDDVSQQTLLNLAVGEIKRKRKNNAAKLYDLLFTSKNLKPLFENIDLKTMTPLFVPIIVKDNKKRSELLKLLINNNIYCPVHWPVPNGLTLNKKNSEIYERELSLVCDQRYANNDMEQIIKTIGDFEENYA